jgi:hypothetical protein
MYRTSSTQVNGQGTSLLALRRRKEEGRERAETVNGSHLQTIVSEKRRELSCGGNNKGNR